jgi:hypothetical protein
MTSAMLLPFLIIISVSVIVPLLIAWVSIFLSSDEVNGNVNVRFVEFEVPIGYLSYHTATNPSTTEYEALACGGIENPVNTTGYVVDFCPNNKVMAMVIKIGSLNQRYLKN